MSRGPKKVGAVRKRLARAVLGVVVIAGGAGTGIGLLASPSAAAGSSYMVRGWTPEGSPGGCGCGNWEIFKGTSVTMRCWTTGPYTDGTGKWFYIESNAYPFTEGYVPANAVGSQATVGRC